MRKRTHQVLSLFMSFTLALALLPLTSVTVLAAWDGSVEISDWYGDGTATNYSIDTAAELAGLAVVVNGTTVAVDGFTGSDDFSGKTVTITDDIDLSGTSGWTPIGGFSKEFEGAFDGGGHAISNLAIGTPSSPDSTLNTLGLFGYIGSFGEVKNLNVSVSIHSSYGDDSSEAFLGAIAAFSIGRIENCSSSGDLAGGYKSYVGGIVGSSGESLNYGVVTGCHSSCDVSAVAGGLAGDAHVGGIAGYNERSEVSSCYATGNVTVGSGTNWGFAGGLLGTNYLGTITNSYATGDVFTLDLGIAGGLTGYNDGTVQNCHATGSVTTGNGGISGGFTGNNIATGSDPNIINCYSMGNAVSGDSNADNKKSFAGGFAGWSTSGIRDCHSSGNATAGNATANSDSGYFKACAGGFVGFADGGSGDYMENCTATGFATVGDATVGASLTDSYAYVYAGGFAGHISGMNIDNCRAVNDAACGSLSIAGTNEGYAYAGGFAGDIYGYKQYSYSIVSGSVRNSYSTGNASGGANAVVGGFAGGAFAETLWGSVSYTVVSNSYASGDVTGNSCASLGGFVGHNYYGAIENCYGAGTVSYTGSPGNIGGFAGKNEAYSGTALLENAYYDSAKNPLPLTGVGSNNSGTDRSLGLDPEVMTGAAGSISYATSSGPASASAFVDALNGGIGLFDLSSESYLLWAADSGDTNGGYPVFAGSWQDAGNTASSFDGGNGSDSAPYQISSNAQLAYLAKLINNSSTYNTYKDLYYVLTADINLSGNQWVPIGKSDSYIFEGVFEGEGHLISGLTVGTSGAADTSLNETGLFGCVKSGAVIENVGVSVSIHSYGSVTGGLAGSNNGTIRNCYVRGSVESGDGVGVGGLAGYNEGTIQNCYVWGGVKCGNNAIAGGLVGQNDGTVQNCYASADVTGGTGGYVGGLIGADVSGTVQNAYYDGNAAQTISGSAQSPLGTGFEAGTMKGSITELSSTVMTSAGFVVTLNGGIISLFGGASLYNAWYADSSTTHVNGGYPVFNAPPVPTTANADNNTVSVSSGSITVGVSTIITAGGDRHSDAGAVYGDERYIPTSWTSTEAGKNGVFTMMGSVYTSDYTPSSAGSYTITATFQMQTWDGSAWNDVSGSIDTKTAAITVNSAGDDSGSGGGSGGGGGSDTPDNGAPTDYGALKKEGSACTAVIDSGKLSLDEKGKAIVIAMTDTTVKNVNFQLTVADLKKIADNQSTLQLETPFGIYKLPAVEIDFISISEKYPNVNYGNILLNVAFVKVDGSNAVLDGAEIIGQPVEMSVVLEAGGKKIELDEFTQYVERDLPVADGKEFITGVVIEDDGTLRHVPTKETTINGKKYAAVFSRTNSVYCLIDNKVSFKDMTGHWAEEIVNDMASRLIVGGAGNNTFAPDLKITRAQFATIVVKALGLISEDDAPFTDVASGAWYHDEVEAAYKYGIVLGGADGKFRPNDYISRQEAMVMVSRAMKIAGMDTSIADEGVSSVLSRFTDSGMIPGWAEDAAATAVQSGIVNGSNWELRPNDKISRAETAVMVQRLLQKAGLR